jgi:hypothetical protein
MNGQSNSPRDSLQNAAHFWEPRRIVFNLVLALIVIGWLVLTWPHFRPAFTLDNLFRLLGLAGLANIFYSVAYVIDLPLQFTSIRNVWQRRRWILWTIGMLFAILITFYWIADEIYPYVNVSSG